MEEITKQAFEKARTQDAVVPRFFETRILASVREQQQLRKGILFWRAATAACALGLAAVSAFFFRGETRDFEIALGTPVVVHVALEKVPRDGTIASAQIDLPPGVTFYSKLHPERSAQTVLRLALQDGIKSFPFAVRASDPGKRSVYVRLLDQQGKLVSEKVIHLDVKGT